MTQHKPKKTFSRRLSLNIVFYVSVLFLICLAIVAISSHKLITDEATRSAENMLHATINEIEVPLTVVEVSTKASADVSRLVLADSGALRDIVTNMVSRNRLIVGSTIALVPHDGVGFCSPYAYRDSLSGPVRYKHLEEGGYDYTQEDWFSVPYATRSPYWSNPYFDAFGAGCLMTTYSVPILDADSNVLAVITSDLPLDWVEGKVSSIRPYENSYASILCPNGIVLGIKDSALQEEGDSLTVTNDQLATIIDEMRRGGDSMMRFRSHNNLCFAVYGPLHNGWSLSIVCNYRDVLYRTSQMNLILVLIGIAGLLVMFFICYRTIRHITKPIAELSQSAHSIAEGNFHTPLPEIVSQDEMLELRDAFDYMQVSLDKYLTELRTTTADKMRMEGELNVARKIQLGILNTQFPDNLSALLIPAKEVGGDLYDFAREDNRIYFSIGDVSGKGVPAAIMMAICRAALRFVGKMGFNTAQVMSRINNGIAESNANCMFVTLFLGCYDTVSGTLEYCNAGHDPIIVIPPQGSPYLLPTKPNLAAGILLGFDYESQTVQLLPGTRLLLYTDGVTEAEDAQHHQFGMDRLMAFAASLKSTESDAEVVKQLHGAVLQFAQGAEQSDDITILSISL